MGAVLRSTLAAATPARRALRVRRSGVGRRSLVVIGAGALAAAGVAAGCSGPGADTPSSIGWDEVDAPGFVADVYDDGQRLVAVGATAAPGDPAAAPAAWVSPDGRTWTPAIVEGPGRMTAVAGPEMTGGDGPIVAGGDQSDNGAARAVAWTSADGVEWTVTSGDAALDPAPGCASTSIEDVASGPRGYVAVGTEWGSESCGQHAAAWWSQDGVTWERVEAPGGHAMHEVLADHEGYVAAGAGTAEGNEGARAAFWFSPDGRSWTQVAGDQGLHGAEVKALARDAHGFAAVGYAIGGADGVFQPAAWRSPDGRAWTRLEADGFTWPSDGAARTAMAIADGLVATDAGLVATGVAASVILDAGGDMQSISPWRHEIWTARTDDGWTVLDDRGAPDAGPGDRFLSGPSAAIFRDERLLLFGSVIEPGATGRPSETRPKAWALDALALGLGPDVMMNAWWKDQGGGVAIGAAPDAGGPLSAANCPTLEEARAAVPGIEGIGEVNAVPFKNMLLQCSYAAGGLDRSGRPAGVGILVFDTEGLGSDMWAGIRTEPDRPNLVEIPGLDAVAFATGEPGHEDVWVATDMWALHMSSTTVEGVPLDQMTALARVTLESLQRPPR